jgi:hypothetical protein
MRRCSPESTPSTPSTPMNEIESSSALESTRSDLFMNLALILLIVPAEAAGLGLVAADLAAAISTRPSEQRSSYAHEGSYGAHSSETPYTATLCLRVPLQGRSPEQCVEPLVAIPESSSEGPLPLRVTVDGQVHLLDLGDQRAVVPVPGVGEICAERTIESAAKPSRIVSSALVADALDEDWVHRVRDLVATVTFTPSADKADAGRVSFAFELDVQAPVAWPSTSDLSLGGIESVASVGLEQKAHDARVYPYSVRPRLDLPDARFLYWTGDSSQSTEMLGLLQCISPDVEVIEPLHGDVWYTFRAWRSGSASEVRLAARSVHPGPSGTELDWHSLGEHAVPAAGTILVVEGLTPGDRLRFQLADGGHFSACTNQGHVQMVHRDQPGMRSECLSPGCSVHGEAPSADFEAQIVLDRFALSVLPAGQVASRMQVSRRRQHLTALLDELPRTRRQLRVGATFHPDTEGQPPILDFKTTVD